MESSLPLEPDDKPMIISYMTLRKCVGFMGLLLAPVLVCGNLLLCKPPQILESVSAYYYSSMRDVMEGTMCGISLFLLSYRGYMPLDSVISKLAGLFALCVALIPTSTTDPDGAMSTAHYIAAGIFFALLAYMSIFLFTRTSGQITKQKRKRNVVYRVCGIVMAVAVAGIPLDKIHSIHVQWGFLKPILLLETIALTAFGISWLTKGELILKD